MKDIHQDQHPPKPGLQSSLAQRAYINPLSLLPVWLWSQPIWSPSLVSVPGPRRSSEDPGSPFSMKVWQSCPGHSSDYFLNYLSNKGHPQAPGNHAVGTRGKRELKTHISTLSTPKPHKDTTKKEN